MKDETYQKRLKRVEAWLEGQIALRPKVERVLDNINVCSCAVRGFVDKLNKAGVKHINWCSHWAVEAEDIQAGHGWDKVSYRLIVNTTGDLKLLWKISRDGERRYGEVFSLHSSLLEEGATRILDGIHGSSRMFNEVMKALERLTPALDEVLDKTLAVMELEDAVSA